MPLNHLGGRIRSRIVVRRGRYQLLRRRTRPVHAVRGLDAGPPHRDGAGAAGGRHAVSSATAPQWTGGSPRGSTARRRGRGRGRAARAGVGRTGARRLRRHRAAGRARCRTSSSRAWTFTCGRLRHDRGRAGVQRRRHHAAAGDRLQTHRRSRTGLLPHRQASSAWRTAGQVGRPPRRATTSGRR